MADQKATPGRIVLYTLTEYDVETLLKIHGDPPRGMNAPRAGDALPALVVKVWSAPGAPNDLVNLQVFLDGPATYWAPSRDHADEPTPGSWHWPPRT